MIGDAHAHRVLLLVQHDARDLLGPPQDERVGSGSKRLHGTELVIINDHELAQLRKRVAQQREVVLVIELTDGTDCVHTRLVARLRGDRIAGVGRQRDRAAAFQQVNDRINQTCLRILRVHLDVRHVPIVHETPIGR